MCVCVYLLPPDSTLRSIPLPRLIWQQLVTGMPKWRRMVDRNWPLTPVIRYWCCNWPAVFFINGHYGPLCWPVPLVVLLFLEASGNERASVLCSPHPAGLKHFCFAIISITPHQLWINQQSRKIMQWIMRHFKKNCVFEKGQLNIYIWVLWISSEMYDLSTALSFIWHLIRRFCPEHLCLFRDLQMYSSC